MPEEKMQETNWNSQSRLDAGKRYQRQSAEMGAAATAMLVEAARIKLGQRVLDVACGAGEPAISQAMMLKDSGSVVGIDFADGPLEVARARAAKRGLTNIEFTKADVHCLPFPDASFDRITSRLGVMFFRELPRALGELHRVLRPGGRLALLAWGSMQQSYWQMTVGTILRLRPELTIPDSARVLFKFGEPGSLARALTAAGFEEVAGPVVPCCWSWHGTPEQLWDYFHNVTAPFRGILDAVAGDIEVEQAILDNFRSTYDGEYVRITVDMVLATAQKP
ncbi:MAG: class I SAM-dependent methyltransferase [Acidobacteriota bacterium]|nr:class I SAM-dependent methyltransferase [Acidobacteriota bacterium]